MKWYVSNCNGDWEHSYGVKIDTLDNPGWTVSIDLSETYLSDRPFEKISEERSEDDWYFCEVKDGLFKAAGGIVNLEELLTIFLKWSAR